MKQEAVVAYIGLGSNQAKPFLQIRDAMTNLAKVPDIRILQDSGCYTSSPMGPQDQPDFVNAVAEISTTLSAHELLAYCKKIEQQQERIRTRHWGERTIDLDILLYGDETIHTETLEVPHPGLCVRDFVYLPLLKVNPDIIVPKAGLLREIIASSRDDETGYDCQFAGNIE